ncbi:MAG TPA: cytochrome c biogenesis protein ResB [Terriglobales bacterium]|nr:cytochrome c biogenesis protein ResB [Terriglobales bacterium]
MALDIRNATRKAWQTAAAIKTGVVLLILVVIFAVVGTVILQRPVTEPDEMQRAYSPQALRILDTVGLTDVFHSWWFVTLMLLVSLSIIAASIERFPNAWRYYARPYKYPDESFRRALHPQKGISIPDEESGLVAAERALHAMGFKPERVVREDHFGIFAERNRISEMAVFIVHASLLLIFFGGIIDGLYGWRGTLNLNEGETSNLVELRDGKTKALPFAIRCDSAGQENYENGMPKKWWSKLVVVKDGQDLQKKEIVVNDPLVFGGIRFYQSSFGSNGKAERLALEATSTVTGEKKQVSFAPNETAALDANTAVLFAEFIPDFALRDGQVYRRSNQLGSPAARLVVTTKQGKSFNVWLPPMEGAGDNANSPYQFEATGLKLGHFTGLQVSQEPGQWGVWGGVVLMGIGLAFVFYIVHMRFWAVPVRDAKTGKYSLWIGGAANRNRDAFEQRFNDLVAEIEKELKSVGKPAPSEHAETVAGR